ncbi:MAG: tetratricopeptide repeat protein [Candidatus Omnitrophota bacterium]
MSKQKVTIVFFQLMISLMLIVLWSGCSAPSVYQKEGLELYRSGDYDKAVEHFEKAFKDKPNNNSKVLLFRAKLNSYFNHMALARSYKQTNKKEEAIKEYKIALSLFPDNKKVSEELETYIAGKKEETVPFQSSVKPPISLKVDPNEKMNVKLKNTPITKIFTTVGKSFGVNFVFDKDFRDFVYSMEVDNIGFYDILAQLCMVAGADYRILDKASVMIYPDNTFKKRTFGLRGVKVFYLVNIKAEDAKKLLMAVFRESQILIQEDTNLNSLIVRGDYASLVEVDRFLNSIDKKKSEVMLDVQILEVTKTLIQALGVNYGAGDPSTPLINGTAGTVGSDGKIVTPANVNNLKNANFFITIPTAALSFLESDDKNRLIAKPNLRGVDGEEIKFMVGDEVPVPQTQFQAGAAGGVANVPVTTYQYKNVGVEVTVTPYVHKENEVSLKIKLSINSISGYENGFPLFGKREYQSVIRLKEGETNIIGGFIRDELRGGLKGIPALARIPIIGSLFGSTNNTVKQTDLIFSITPQVIRRVEVRSEDEETIWSGSQAPAAGGGGEPVQTRSEIQSRTPQIQPPQEEQNRPSGDSIAVMPSKRRVPANTDTYFTIRVDTATPLASLAFSGSVSGPKAVVDEVKADFFGGRNVQVMKNFSGSGFDLGYTFPDDRASLSVVAQIRVKFQEKGNYTINLSGVSAATKDHKTVNLSPLIAEVEVF